MIDMFADIIKAADLGLATAKLSTTFTNVFMLAF